MPSGLASEEGGDRQCRLGDGTLCWQQWARSGHADKGGPAPFPRIPPSAGTSWRCPRALPSRQRVDSALGRGASERNPPGERQRAPATVLPSEASPPLCPGAGLPGVTGATAGISPPPRPRPALSLSEKLALPGGPQPPIRQRLRGGSWRVCVQRPSPGSGPPRAASSLSSWTGSFPRAGGNGVSQHSFSTGLTRAFNPHSHPITPVKLSPRAGEGCEGTGN